MRAVISPVLQSLNTHRDCPITHDNNVPSRWTSRSKTNLNKSKYPIYLKCNPHLPFWIHSRSFVHPCSNVLSIKPLPLLFSLRLQAKFPVLYVMVYSLLHPPVFISTSRGSSASPCFLKCSFPLPNYPMLTVTTLLVCIHQLKNKLTVTNESPW